jgi:CRP-like cAMP-binding protein
MHRSDGSDDLKELANVPLFSAMTTKELELVRGQMSLVEVGPGHVLARQGARGVEFFIILAGTASVERDGVQVATVGPGDFQGEISLLDGGPRTATVTTVTPVTLLVATYLEFNALLDQVPTLARRMLPALAHRVRQYAEDEHTH